MCFDKYCFHVEPGQSQTVCVGVHKVHRATRRPEDKLSESVFFTMQIPELKLRFQSLQQAPRPTSISL